MSSNDNVVACERRIDYIRAVADIFNSLVMTRLCTSTHASCLHLRSLKRDWPVGESKKVGLLDRGTKRGIK